MNIQMNIQKRGRSDSVGLRSVLPLPHPTSVTECSTKECFVVAPRTWGSIEEKLLHGCNGELLCEWRNA
jgi:hypothetical protein